MSTAFVYYKDSVALFKDAGGIPPDILDIYRRLEADAADAVAQSEKAIAHLG